MASVFKRNGDGAFLAAWHDHNGKRQVKSTRTTDKRAAERIAAKYEADAALRREGVIDPQLESINGQAKRLIESHIDDYRAKLMASGRSSQYITETLKYIRTVCDAAGVTTPAEITADGVNRFAATLKQAGSSARTIQGYLTAIKGFTKWLAEHDKLQRNPLASVRKPNPKTDRRYERRVLLPDEWKWLKATISDVRGKTPAAERILLYETAIQTGLRSSELRSLTPARLHLDAERPYVTCKASNTKNAKDARLYVSAELAAALRKHVAKQSPKAPVFALPSEFKMPAMIRSDLAAARTAWLDEAHGAAERKQREESDFLVEANHDGGRLDFHTLRHTCGAWLAMQGVHPKVVQTVMRHSAITLTMDTYGHLFPGQEADAVDQLGAILNTSLSDTSQRQAQQSGHETLRRVATHGDKSTDNSNSSDEPETSSISRENATNGDGLRRNSVLLESPPEGKRMASRLIRNQLPRKRLRVRVPCPPL